jgi:transcriptional regulator with XRE-family HTH domain
MAPEQPDAPNFINPADLEIDAAAAALDPGLEIDAAAAAIDRAEGWSEPVPDRPTVEERFGQAVLRLRLYRGWTQRDVQRTCGVHQSQVSRLETGKSGGLSMRRVVAILRALHADEIEFRPATPIVPPTELERMLWGDPWERAGRAAERRRVNRRRSA